MNTKRFLTILAVCCAAYPVMADTNSDVIALSGVLHKSQPKEALKPYYLYVIMAGGANQRVLLSGDVLHKFDDQLKKFGEIPDVRVKGHFRAEWKKYSGTAQPTPDGWLVWLEVQEATTDTTPPEKTTSDNATEAPEPSGAPAPQVQR